MLVIWTAKALSILYATPASVPITFRQGPTELSTQVEVFCFLQPGRDPARVSEIFFHWNPRELKNFLKDESEKLNGQYADISESLRETSSCISPATTIWSTSLSRRWRCVTLRFSRIFWYVMQLNTSTIWDILNIIQRSNLTLNVYSFAPS